MSMPFRNVALCAAAASLSMAAAAGAETMRSSVALNTAIQQQAAEQPPDGVAVTYAVVLSGGELDGCNVDIAESLYPRDDGAWGIFEVDADVACDDGGFRYVTSGAWDGNGFHGAGHVVEGSGSGNFEGLTGRIAQLGGSIAPGAESGTLEIGYDLLIDGVD